MFIGRFLLRAGRGRFKRFASDRRGAIAILFALAVLPLIFLIGLAVDFRSLQTSRANMQNALDAALLAAARTYTSNSSLSDSERENLASSSGQAMWESNLADAGRTLISPHITFTYTKATNRVHAVGEAAAPTAFGGLAGINSVDIQVEGSARGADPRRIEVVLSLDNTGSMYNNDRMILMRGAAMNFVEKLFTEQSQPNKLYIGVVPWTTTVNINMEQPIATWDSSGTVTPDTGFEGTRVVPPSPFQNFRNYTSFPENHGILNENGSWSSLGGVAYDGSNATHTAAWDALFAPVAWRGCIRNAPNEREVSSWGTVTNTLTDAPPTTMRWQADAIEPILKTFSGNSRIRCGSSSSTNQKDNSYNSYFDKAGRTCYTSNSSSASTTTVDYTTSSPEKYRAACVSDANEFSYLQTKSFCAFKDFTLPRASYNDPWMAGPNVNCPTAMLGLSGNKVQILNALNRMYANSDGTHQDVGVMWGLRMLSPRAEWKSFFGHTGANAPWDYDTDQVRKVLILLTDGENVVPSLWEGYYGCSASSSSRGSFAGSCWNSSAISGGISGSKLDALTRDACRAVREDYDIELYTIAVDVTNSDAIDLLEDCAGGTARAYNISASEINATFLEIANETLRLTD